MAEIRILRVEGMHCSSCGLLIDDALEDLSGVHTARTSVTHSRTVVELDPHGSLDDVVAVIADLGYAVREAPA